MSHYYSSIQGHRGEATRCGTRSSGITANATGWDIGGTVSMRYDPLLSTDVVTFTLTGGSNGRTTRKVASFAIVNGSLQLVSTNYPEIFI